MTKHGELLFVRILLHFLFGKLLLDVHLYLCLTDSEKKDGKESPRIGMGSAFLGPNLWDKTYDMDDFKLEYMDLDEFLSENGLPIATDDTSNHSQRSSGSNSSHGRGQQGLQLEMPSPPQGPPPQAPATSPARHTPPSSPGTLLIIVETSPPLNP